MQRPNFLIVGAAKSGTTSIHYYLSQSKEVGFSKIKEPKYFSTGYDGEVHHGPGDVYVDSFVIRDFTSYLNLFSDIETKLIGEASPNYLYNPKSAERIFSQLGDVPIIIVLRSPIFRAFSSYSYLSRDGRETKTFREGLELEKKRIESGYDFIWHYTAVGMYKAQIERYQALFTKVKIVVFEEFITNTLYHTNEILDFLGAHKLDKIDGRVMNPSGKANLKPLRFLLNKNNDISNMSRDFIKRLLPRVVLDTIASRYLDRLSIEENDFIFLLDKFSKEIAEIEILLDRNLSIWREFRI